MLSLFTIGPAAAVAGVAITQVVLAVLVMLVHVACAVLDSRLHKHMRQAAVWSGDGYHGQAAAAAAVAAAAAASPTDGGGAGGVVYGLKYSPEGRIRSFELHEVL